MLLPAKHRRPRPPVDPPVDPGRLHKPAQAALALFLCVRVHCTRHPDVPAQTPRGGGLIIAAARAPIIAGTSRRSSSAWTFQQA